MVAKARAPEIERAWAAGYATAIEQVKAAQHALYNVARDLGRVERGRWWLRGEPRTRATFGQPHPDDFPGRQPPSDAAAAAWAIDDAGDQHP